ncbi:MAG: endopeptidase La, partial [Patescibacteria group bacterium]
AAIKNSNKSKSLVVLLTQKNPKIDKPQQKDLYPIGTLAVIERTLKTDGQVNALVRGVGRVKVKSLSTSNKGMLAQVNELKDIYSNKQEIKALASHLQKEFRKAVHMGKPVEFLNFMKLMSGVTHGELVDQIASALNISTIEKQDVLKTLEVGERLKKVINFLAKEMKILEIEKDVAHKTQKKFDKSMRESVLRERLVTIQKELGEIEDEEEVNSSYESKLKKAKFSSEEIKTKVKKELKRLKQMSPNNPEGGYIRTWLDTIFELPWGKYKKSSLDLTKAAKILDRNHYGLEKVKDRILEYMAVLQLKQKNSKAEDQSNPIILCFVGPPGVGKTSIGKAIAESMGRTFVKVSLGGIRDEAEIRGHRRTYVGAMAGRIINGIKQSGSMNPIFMLDEIDKIGKDFRGDPSAALLETLDSEQNKNFEDHYLDIPFDLSQVLFITTANTLDTIPPALKDRLEVIRYSGYTVEEKFNIAKKHLLSKVLKNNGLSRKDIGFSNTAINAIISNYTREAGVRDLERNLSKVLRKVARNLIEKKFSTKQSQKTKIAISNKNIKKFLGAAKFDPTLTEKKNQIALAMGLAWTSVGGDVLFIEVALTPGKGKVILTGKLGDVMKESAQAAYTYVKANAKKLQIKQADIEKHDVHIHVPEGAVPKDGPSAGVTITTAIVSAFTKKKVRRDIAMTGEVTLRGRVLRIGGLKEKSIAAHRAGSKLVLIPKDNERDLDELPKSVKKDLKFTAVDHVSKVLKLSLID